ncbi:ParA family protein [Teichococcus vastitatis]|jgi:chromosome partitioning protein|uniref:ParA family protein n=1 Tax=Teichococcus vastitatis TaxID=2307076 RepID=A0ABS9W8I5_9PROT|nr:ParA family protein [Pseudoroseomonas vastitatis]MCI0755617.1 ParA family protein [Pseudoroseomonas vastitatis]
MGVLVVAGSKGGTGKSLLSMSISAFLARKEADFALIDADPTEASSRWSRAIYEGMPIETHAERDEDKLAHLIADLSEQKRLVIVDTPGFDNLSSSVAIASADYVLVPCKSSEADLYEARATMNKVRSLARSTRREIPARVVLNSVRSTTVANHAASEIRDAGLSPLKCSLGHRADYEVMTHSGKLPINGTAARELRALMAELTELGWLPK